MCVSMMPFSCSSLKLIPPRQGRLMGRVGQGGHSHTDTIAPETQGQLSPLLIAKIQPQKVYNLVYIIPQIRSDRPLSKITVGCRARPNVRSHLFALCLPHTQRLTAPVILTVRSSRNGTIHYIHITTIKLHFLSVSLSCSVSR